MVRPQSEGEECIWYHTELAFNLPCDTSKEVKANFPPFNTGKHRVHSTQVAQRRQKWRYEWEKVQLVPLLSFRLTVREKDSSEPPLTQEFCVEGRSPATRVTNLWSSYVDYDRDCIRHCTVEFDVVMKRRVEPLPTFGAIAHSLTIPRPTQVRFSFTDLGRALFANAAVLKAASPYFDSLLESNFAEGQLKQGLPLKDVTSGGSWSNEESSDDDELHEPWGPYHDVVITQVDYSTYHAVLLYLHTGHITFADAETPLGAPTADGGPDPEVEGTFEVSSIEQLHPVCASPVYDLAIRLELDKLASLALIAFRESLSPDNIIHYLCSDLCTVDSELGNVAVESAVEQWTSIERELEKLMDKSDDEGSRLSPVVAFKLMKELRRRANSK